MRVTKSFAATVACLLAAGCVMPVAAPVASNPAPRSTSAYTEAEGRIFELINAERARQGLRPLAFNERLGQMARIQAQNMAHFQKMAHVLPEARLPTLADRAHYTGYPFGEIAENVALGYPSPEAVVRGWMNSSGHRRNILNTGVVETGIAIARSSAGGLYYCQVFGRRLSSI